MSSKMGDEARIDDIDEIAGFRAAPMASVAWVGRDARGRVVLVLRQDERYIAKLGGVNTSGRTVQEAVALLAMLVAVPPPDPVKRYEVKGRWDRRKVYRDGELVCSIYVRYAYPAGAPMSRVGWYGEWPDGSAVMVEGGARASADKWMGWESEELWARVVWPGGGAP
jgi:hypothetical protein